MSDWDWGAITIGYVVLAVTVVVVGLGLRSRERNRLAAGTIGPKPPRLALPWILLAFVAVTGLLINAARDTDSTSIAKGDVAAFALITAEVTDDPDLQGRLTLSDVSAGSPLSLEGTIPVPAGCSLPLVRVGVVVGAGDVFGGDLADNSVVQVRSAAAATSCAVVLATKGIVGRTDAEDLSPVEYVATLLVQEPDREWILDSQDVRLLP